MADAARLRLDELSRRGPVTVELRPGPERTAALAGELGLLALRKLSLRGTLTPRGRRDWELTAMLGATVVQPCVVTLAPVTTRIDEPVERIYTADFAEPEEADAELPADDRLEPLPETLDLEVLIAEALTLALPLYPRAPGVELGPTIVTEPGAEPLTDEAARPFAGLKDLRDRLTDED